MQDKKNKKKKIDIENIEEMENKETAEERNMEEEIIDAEPADAVDENPTDGGDELSKELDRAKNQMLRMQAEFINYKKRVEKDKKDTIIFANEKLLIEILEVVDNFHRALDSEKEHDSFFQGMEMIFNQLDNILKENGLEEIESDGQVFDPHLHSAVIMEDSDEVESGRITETMRKGYKLNGKLIRPAMVKVAK